jgi:hypothetical protein
MYEGMCMTLFLKLLWCACKVVIDGSHGNGSTVLQTQAVRRVRQCEADVAHARQQRQSAQAAFGRLSNIKLTGWFIMNCDGRWPGE